MRTSRLGLALLSLAAAQPACAEDPRDTLRLFADCAGRYAAITEHLWLFDGPASEASAARRDAFADLAAALAPEVAVAPATLRGWRIEARAAQRALLSAATFGHQAAGGNVAAAHRMRCDRLLPGV